MLILGRKDVLGLLDGAEAAVCDVVDRAYVAHAAGDTVVPHSVFLRFPGNDRDRVIGLPAFVGGERPVAGIKWIASFPGNIDNGQERASAAILLNSMDTGQPVALIEGSIVSARRTAASAALAARALTAQAPPGTRSGAALVGCGVINFEVLRFLRVCLPDLSAVTVYDTDPARAAGFAERCAARWPDLRVETVADAAAALAAHRVVSIATTATTPHLGTEACLPGTVVLHVSLRDLFPEAILTARNVVDDADHACREGTSLALAERSSGNRAFIHAEIGDVLSGDSALGHDAGTVTVFSPFGLGALDAALAAYVLDTATARGLGTRIADFLA